jgi:hypothetical protein
LKKLSYSLNKNQVMKSEELNRSYQYIYFINIYKTSWKLKEYTNFDRLEYGPVQINWAIDLRNDSDKNLKVCTMY